MLPVIAVASLLALSSRSFAADCFFPNGRVSGLDTACNPNAIVSTCCFDGQACLSNGLCVSDPHNETLARLHRGTCTDKDWKSGNCLRQCLDVAGNGAPVYSCNSTTTESFCCGEGCKCDGNEFETFTSPEPDVFTMTIIGESFTQTHTPSASSTSTPGASASTTGASNVGATNNPANTPNPSASTDSKSSKTTAIGVGLGAGAGVLILLGVAFFFWRRKKRSNVAPVGKLAELDSEEYYRPSEKHAQYAVSSTQSAHTQRPVELSSEQTPPVELSASPRLQKYT